MTEEQIIKQIKLHPVLYNSALAKYRDPESRNIAWEEIARKVNSNVEDVKTKWSKLRNSYTNALKRRYRKNSIQTIPWKFQKQMEFLIPHLKYKSLSNPKISVEVNDYMKDESQTSYNEDYESQYDRAISPASSAKYVSPIDDDIGSFTPENSPGRMNSSFFKDFINGTDPLNESKQILEIDETDHFFLSMSKLLKKLPPEDQVDIKFELHKLIYEAEKRQLKKNGSY